MLNSWDYGPPQGAYEGSDVFVIHPTKNQPVVQIVLGLCVPEAGEMRFVDVHHLELETLDYILRREMQEKGFPVGNDRRLFTYDKLKMILSTSTLHGYAKVMGESNHDAAIAFVYCNAEEFFALQAMQRHPLGQLRLIPLATPDP